MSRPPNRPSHRRAVSGSRDRGDGLWRPVPTPDLQRLYNKWRDEEDGLSLSERIQLHGLEDENGLLAVPSDPDAASMSRSTSQNSTQSITQDMGDVQLVDDGTRPSARRGGRKRGRPLSMYARHRTNFMRKLGA